MPIVGVLDGITFKMYFQQEEHNPPHVHAFYGDGVDIIYINNDRPQAGTLKEQQKRIAKDWVEAHTEPLKIQRA